MRPMVAITCTAFLGSVLLAACAGSDGAPGPSGATGPAGAQGGAGPAGTNGNAGAVTTGTNGTNGTNGTMGAPGEAGAPPSYPIPTNGLVGYYRGDGHDLSGGGHDATPTAVTIVSDRFGMLATAAHFDGAAPSYFTVANDPVLPTGASARAVSVWFRTAGTAVFGAIFNWGNAASPAQRFGELVQALPSGQDYFVGQWADLPGRAPLADDDWHHVVVNYDGVSVAVYVDDVLSVAGPVALDTTGQDLFIGVSKNPSLGTEPFTGDIDSLRIYDRVLTHEERDALFHEGGWH